MSDIEYKVTKRYGKIDRGDNKWPLEVNEVSWNDRPAKIDIRFWTPDAKPRKGITLTTKEARELRDILAKI